MRKAGAGTLALLVLVPVFLAGCEKPNPGATVFSGTTSKWREAVCWSHDAPALEPGSCAQDLIERATAGGAVAEVPVVPGETVGISVDPVVADTGWFPVIGNQRLTTRPITSTYYRFTYPDLQEVPEGGTLLQVVAGVEETRGIWVFSLVPAA